MLTRRALLAALAFVTIPLRALAAARPQKQVLAFYYGWYGPDSHWKGVDTAKKTIANTTDYPAAGPYDSLDPETIERHVNEARNAGITGLICSWWSKSDRTDQQLKPLLEKAHAGRLAITVYVENAASAQDLADACLYLLTTYGDHPAWLKLDGKPVLFFYDRVLQTLGLDGWKAARAIIDKTMPDKYAVIATGNSRRQIAERAPLFAGTHIYDMPYYLSEPHVFEWLWLRGFYRDWVKYQKGQSVITATVMPGYDDHLLGRPEPRPMLLRDDGRLYRDLWQAAIAAAPDWILIVSFNEWHEGSEIEPSVEHGDRELKTTKEMSARFMG